MTKDTFERLMLLIAVIVQNPGIGYRDPDSPDKVKNPLEEIQSKIVELAKGYDIKLSPNPPSTATISKDFKELRKFGILKKSPYKWGYYLGTGVMSKQQLKIAFDAIASQANYQGDPKLREIHKELSRKSKGLEADEQVDFFYPVRLNLNRSINHTDPYEMMEKQQNHNNLFHKINDIELSIIERKAVEIKRTEDLYNNPQILGGVSVYPLQLIYYDIAWYLLYEHIDSGLLEIGRINRYGDYCRFLDQPPRGLEAQKSSLDKAHKLQKNGWGLYLGDKEEQELELQGKLEFIEIKVRFYRPVCNFILEGELRHPKQKIKAYSKEDKITKGTKPEYIDYEIKLPRRSHSEFLHWVQRYLDKAKIFAPEGLAQKHLELAKELVKRYQ